MRANKYRLRENAVDDAHLDTLLPNDILLKNLYIEESLTEDVDLSPHFQYTSYFFLSPCMKLDGTYNAIAFSVDLTSLSLFVSVAATLTACC